MPDFTDIRQAAQNSKLLGRCTAALERVASDIFAAATDPAEARLAWAKRAWITVGESPRVQWYAQRMLEHAIHQSPALRAAIDANKDDPQVSDADILAFANTYATRCVALNI